MTPSNEKTCTACQSVRVQLTATRLNYEDRSGKGVAEEHVSTSYWYRCLECQHEHTETRPIGP